MPPMQDEGRRSATGPRAYFTGRIFAYPDKVALHASGWATPIGAAIGLMIERFCKEEEGNHLIWYLITMKEVQLSRAAALLVVQGLHLNKLFPPDLHFKEADQPPSNPFRNPPLLLRKDSQNQVDPTKLFNVVLGTVISVEGYGEDDIRSILLQSALTD